MQCVHCGQPVSRGRFCSETCQAAVETERVRCEFCGSWNRVEPTAPLLYCVGCTQQLWRGRHFDRRA